MGKTTLCDKYGYVDDNMYYPQRPAIKQKDIVLTNELKQYTYAKIYNHEGE